MLTGQQAFEADLPIDIVQKVLRDKLPTVSSRRIDIPDVISQIVAKMTQKKMDDRYHSVNGLKFDLVQILKFLGEGDEEKIKNYQIGMKDVSSFFILPSKTVGREPETERVLDVINKLHKHQKSVAGKKRAQATYSISSNSSMMEGRIESVEIVDGSSDSSSVGVKDSRSNSNAGPFYLGSNSGVDSAAFSTKQSLSSKYALEPRLNSWDMSDRESHLSNGMSSSNQFDNMAPMSRHRASHKFRRRGRCEIISLLGPQGVGKTHLIKTVQPTIRRSGYFASARFDRARPTPFEPLIKAMSSLFRQIFSERDVNTHYHDMIRNNVKPIWGVLHNMLDLPEGLLNFSASVAQSGLGGDLNNRTLRKGFPSSDTVSIQSAPSNSGSTNSNEFLRGPANSKSMRFMNTYVDVLRFMSLDKLICICLDDIHAADEESMDLVHSIIKARIPIVLLFASRPEGSIPTHVKNVVDIESNVNIDISNLREKEVFEYVAATLFQEVEAVIPLAAIVYEKSAGNPFLVKEILQTCYDKNCLWYDWRISAWQFDLDRVFTEFTSAQHGSLTTSFITKRLQDMPPAARSILAWASLIGNSFSFALIQKLIAGEYLYSSGHDQGNDVTCPKRAKLFNISKSDCIDGLQVLLNSYILAPGENDDEFRFSHNRYLRAANSMRECYNVKKMHFIIAQTMMKYLSKCKFNLYPLARHICLSSDIVKQRVSSRALHRDVLWRGAQKAVESGAKPTALWYYSVCIDLLQDDHWNDKASDVSYDETLQLYVQAAELFHAQGEGDRALALLNETFRNCRRAADKTRSYILQSRILSGRGEWYAAFNSLKSSLAELGFDLKETSWDDCDIEFKKLEYQIRQLDHAELTSRNLSDDPDVIAMGTVISEALAGAFWSDSLLFYQVSRTAQYYIRAQCPSNCFILSGTSRQHSGFCAIFFLGSNADPLLDRD